MAVRVKASRLGVCGMFAHCERQQFCQFLLVLDYVSLQSILGHIKGDEDRVKYAKEGVGVLGNGKPGHQNPRGTKRQRQRGAGSDQRLDRNYMLSGGLRVSVGYHAWPSAKNVSLGSGY